jgi:3'-phosphoadenosine 5'-phosphosulfate sulfotransferase
VECEKSIQGRFLHEGGKEISTYIRFRGEYRRSDETGVAPNQQVNIHFSMGRGIQNMNQAQSLSIGESYQQL